MSDVTELSQDAQVFLKLVGGGTPINNWMFGMSLQRLRPDIAERLIKAWDEISSLNSDISDRRMEMIMASDEYLQVIVEMFEGDSVPN